MNGDEKSMLKSKTLMKKPMSRGASNNHELSISFFLSICLPENTLLLYAHRIIGKFRSQVLNVHVDVLMADRIQIKS